VTVKGFQLLANRAEIEQAVDLPQHVVGRNMILNAEIVKETTLIHRLPTHHHPIPPK
jgi:hypothetical protein